MKGLLLKEWYGSFRSSFNIPWFVLACSRIFVTTVTFEGWSFWNIKSDIIRLFIVTINVTLACSASFLWEEREKWDTFRGILPYDSKQIVTSKYIFVSGILGFTALYTAIFLCVPFFKKWVSLVECTSMLVWIVSLSLFSVSLMLPGLFRFKGKSKLFYYVFITALLFIFLYFVHRYSSEILRELLAQDTLIFDTSADLPEFLDISYDKQLIIFVLSVVVYLLSWALSIRLYKNREL